VVVKNHELPAHMPEVKRSLALYLRRQPIRRDHQSSEHESGLLRRLRGFGRSAWLRWACWIPSRFQPRPGKDPLCLLHPAALQPARQRERLPIRLGPALAPVRPEPSGGHGAGGDRLGRQFVGADEGWRTAIEYDARVQRREGLPGNRTCCRPSWRSQSGGRSDGMFVAPAELEQAKDTYYAMAGWDAAGVPTRAKLEELA